MRWASTRRALLQPVSHLEGRYPWAEMVSTGDGPPRHGPPVADGAEPADDGRNETRDERRDRDTAEMVQELRFGAVAVQVLFASCLSFRSTLVGSPRARTGLSSTSSTT